MYEKMLTWKERYAPVYALFIKGARRVGKSALAETFGKNEYKSFIKISFDKATSYVKELFVEELDNLDLFFEIIQAIYRSKLFYRESLIILDEI